jgi:hypothetical protein
MSQRTAASHCKIHRRTLNYKWMEKHTQKLGKPTIFTVDEEKALDRCTIKMSDFGFPIDSIDLRHIVRQQLHPKGRLWQSLKKICQVKTGLEFSEEILN